MKSIFSTVTFLILLFFVSGLKAQAPFTTPVKEPRYVQKQTIGAENIFLAVKEKDTTVVKQELALPKASQTKGYKKTEQNDIDFFKNNGLTLSLVNSGENRLSINSQVLHYKLYVANPTENNKFRINRYNIPLMVITKLSSSYDSINASSALDVLDYEAAPITLRVMPSFKKSFKFYRDVIYYGFYADVRGINLLNPEESDYDIEFIGSGGLGFTYQGDGKAGTYDANGEYEDGKYSISLILQAATGKQDVISRLFDTDKDYVTAMQLYFLFKVSDTSPLNIKVGYQHFFQETQGGTKNNFSVTLGI